MNPRILKLVIVEKSCSFAHLFCKEFKRKRDENKKDNYFHSRCLSLEKGMKYKLIISKWLKKKQQQK